MFKYDAQLQLDLFQSASTYPGVLSVYTMPCTVLLLWLRRQASQHWVMLPDISQCFYFRQACNMIMYSITLLLLNSILPLHNKMHNGSSKEWFMLGRPEEKKCFKLKLTLTGDQSNHYLPNLVNRNNPFFLFDWIYNVSHHISGFTVIIWS